MFSRYSGLTSFGIQLSSYGGTHSTAKFDNEAAELRCASPAQLHGIVLSDTPFIFAWMNMEEGCSMHGYVSIWLCIISFIAAGDRAEKESTRCLINWAPRHRDVWGIVGVPIPPPLLKSAIDGSFTLWLFYPRGSRPQRSLYRRFSGLHSQFGRYGEQKHLLSVAGLEPRFLGRWQQITLMLKLILKEDVTAVDWSAILLRMGLHEVPVSMPRHPGQRLRAFLSRY